MSLAPEKTLPSLAIVDLDRLMSNLGVVRRASRAKMVMGVVKANAYGHGDVAIAQTLSRLGCEWLATQMPEEAIKLRQAGITTPILILGYTHSAYASDILHHHLTPTIFDYQLAVELDRLSPEPVSVHIKIDTGMSWAGIAVKDSIPFIKSVQKLSKIKIDGLFTHFSSADSNPYFTHSQAEKFLNVVAQVKELGLNPILHASNSAATMNYPQYHFDIVRPGIMLYGAPCGGCYDDWLLPILSWNSLVCDMKVLHDGECVGYGCSYKANGTRIIATVPVGYADGWPWRYKNGGHVLIRGKKAPIAGRICMDQFMVDVTDIGDVEVGNKVTLIGSDGKYKITAEHIAQVCETTPYEVLTSLHGRTKLRYIQGKKEVEL
jgi:alanine racemase